MASIRSLVYLALSVLLQFAAISYAAVSYAAEDELYLGASVFNERCALCHGSNGAGEGVIPMSIRGYPNTSLLGHELIADYSHVRSTIESGSGSLGSVTQMPPWIDELSEAEIDAVTQFVIYLNAETASAKQLLLKARPSPNLFQDRGAAIFATRCALCHGATGEGDGRMARIIKDPPPYNLTISEVPFQYIQLIVDKGGEALGRSERMPPFGADLMPWEIDSLIEHVLSLRETDT